MKEYEIDGKETQKEFQQLSNVYKYMEIQDFEPIALGLYDNFVSDRLNQFKILATVDDKGYTEKPKDQEEIKKLNNRIGMQARCIDFTEFMDMVGNQGHTFCPAIFESNGKYAPRRKDTFLCQQIFALDFDEGITYEEVLQRAFKYKIPPAFIYKTLSCDDIDLNKFRVIWVLDCIVNDIETTESIIKLLMSIFPEADKSCKDCSRMFFGGKGLIYMESSSYLSRLSLTDLSIAVNNYIKDTQYKERLNRMRTISEETGIVLENGILDIKEKEFTDEQLNILVKYLKPIESKIPFRFYILPNELQEILKEAILDEEHIIYVLIRKICEVDNKVYLIRMNKAKEIKEKVKNVINKKGDITFKTRTNTEYKATRKTRRGITREKLFEKCLLIQDFVNDEYLTFNELFGICTNLSCIEGGLKFFKEVIKNSKHNIARSTDWYAFKAEQIYSQLLLPTRCNNFCEYKYICKHGKNIIQTVKTQRKELVQIGIYDLISLGEAMKKYNEILKELFINE